MDNFDNRPQAYGEVGIYSTAGAVPIKNDKGEISMQKVKVQRYISGKRPDYARGYSESESEQEDEDFISKQRDGGHHDESRSPSPDQDEHLPDPSSVSDPRLRRLLAARMREREEAEEDEDAEEEDRIARLKRRRRIEEPEVVDSDTEEKKVKVEKQESEEEDESDDDSDSSDDEELDEEAISRRRELMRQRALYKAQAGDVQEEVMTKEDEKSGPDSEEEETSEEETDSEDEEGARLKPVFVRAKDRLTIQEREREEARQRQVEKEAARAAEERRRQTLRIVEDEVRKSTMAEQATPEEGLGFQEIVTDDENDEIEYEAWKVRELKRLKREREEAEQFVKEQQELERFRNLTEEEKRQEMRLNPKHVTNKTSKGKYKFMQKYYHRGAFYIDREEDILKRDFTAPTLEDNFNKSVLPKVMQVKNFGRSGRTKYTHLVDQDTTDYDAAWTQETAANVKFQHQHAAGMKQVFDRRKN